MNGGEEYERTWQPPPPLHPELVLEVLPLEEVISLEEVSPLSRIVGADEVTPLEEIPYIEAIPVASLLEESQYVLPVERPITVRAKAGRGFTILAWLVIVPLVIYEVDQNHLGANIDAACSKLYSALTRKPQDGAGAGKKEAGELEVKIGEADPETVALSAQDQFDPQMMEFQARYFVGWNQIAKNEAFYEQVKELHKGPIEQRLRAIVLAGEMVGPDEALKELRRLPTDLSPDQSKIKGILERLYRDFSRKRYDSPSLTPGERELLCRDLDWFGELALAPEGTSDKAAREAVLKPARTTALLLVSVAGGLSLVALIGLIFLIIFLVFLFAGWTRRWLAHRSPYAGVYAETFALWMLAFLVFGFGAQLLWEGFYGFIEMSQVDESVLSAVYESRLGILGLVELSTMLLVFYPVLRGVPWREVKHDLGLFWGRRPLAEPAIGLGCYAMSLPLLGIGFMITIFLMYLTGRMPGLASLEFGLADENFKGHPIVGVLSHADWWGKVQVFFLAAVVAPIVEETMFRGVLYRHLRDLTNGFGFALSLMVSAIVAAFIFAVVHPQDLLAVPALMSLAIGFTLAREWRGSLIPGMVMHGVHNGMLMLLLTIALSL